MSNNINKHNTIGKGKKERAVNGGADKFYTKEYIADYYANIVAERYGQKAMFIEPTAGGGAFLNKNILPNVLGYDLIPENKAIIKQDVFTLVFKPEQIAIGNPPFGMNASLALRIFNHIAGYKVKAICFILPRTFNKVSMQNKLDLNYKLVFSENVIDNAFTVDGENYNVPCVFQIWEYIETPRKKVIYENDSEFFEFTDKLNADIAIRRAGGKAGKLLDGVDHSESSTYFIKIHKNIKEVRRAFRLMDIEKYVNNTAGVKSISKGEIFTEMNKILKILI